MSIMNFWHFQFFNPPYPIPICSSGVELSEMMMVSNSTPQSSSISMYFLLFFLHLLLSCPALSCSLLLKSVHILLNSPILHFFMSALFFSSYFLLLQREACSSILNLVLVSSCSIWLLISSSIWSSTTKQGIFHPSSPSPASVLCSFHKLSGCSLLHKK